MKINRNQLVLPLNYEVLIDENDPVWKLVEICDTLDYTRLYDEYLRHWRAIDPVVMFEILVFAYMNHIYSCRAIEQACKTDVRFMWLLQGQSAPDHATIARFQNERLTGVIEDFAECWKPAYDWMAQKMVERICDPPEGVWYPVWFWHKWNGRHHQPDLRARSSFGPKGQELVLLEVEIPDNRILLSDFDAWHSVLNNCHAYHDARTEAEYQELDRWLDSLSEADRQHEIKKSWDSIFDIAPFENDFCRNGVWVQATAWEIKAEDVVKTRPFIC